MTIIQDINPFLPNTQKITPSKIGGHGKIFYPGQADNIIWQTRSRIPDQFELNLISQLEAIFQKEFTELADVVEQLNQQRHFDRNQQPWTEQSFREYLSINGY